MKSSNLLYRVLIVVGLTVIAVVCLIPTLVPNHRPMDKEQRDALWLLADRAALALEDRQLQQRVFRSLEDLQPQIDMLQRIRAAGRYDSRSSLLTEPLPEESDLADLVKDALTHYWGTEINEQSVNEAAHRAGDV